MDDEWRLIDVIEYMDGSLESVMGKDGSSEIFMKPSSEATVARYKATCDMCGKREWIHLNKNDRCDCDVLIDLMGNTKKVRGKTK